MDNGKCVTRATLERYHKTIKDIQILDMEILDMETTDIGIGTSTILDYRTGYPRPQSISGFNWDKYNSKKNSRERKKREAEEVRSFIESIQDGNTRYVFRMRYIEGITWGTIAKKLGYQSADYPRLLIRDKYLNENEIK